MRLQDTARLMAMLAAAHPNHPVSAETVQTYHAIIGHLTPEQATAAVHRSLSEHEFFPVPAVLLKFARSADPNELTPQQAWLEVMDRVEHWGQKPAGWQGTFRAGIGFVDAEPKPFSNESVERAMNVIGYQALCEMTEEDKPTIRAQLLKAYDALSAKDRSVVKGVSGEDRIHISAGNQPGGSARVGDADLPGLGGWRDRRGDRAEALHAGSAERGAEIRLGGDGRDRSRTIAGDGRGTGQDRG